jgi:hypothetical protein
MDGIIFWPFGLMEPSTRTATVAADEKPIPIALAHHRPNLIASPGDRQALVWAGGDTAFTRAAAATLALAS